MSKKPKPVCTEHSLPIIDDALGVCSACDFEKTLMRECEHKDVEHNTCLDCGENLAETFAARIYDTHKDKNKYGD